MRTAIHLFAKGIGLLSMLIVCVPAPLHGQGGIVSGIVSSVDTKQPIAGAIVALEGTPQKVMTDAFGRYELQTASAPRVAVSIRCLGYQKIVREIVMTDARAVLDVMLQPVILPAQGVVITAARARERETPTTFSNMDPKEIQQKYSVQDVPVLLSELPSSTYYSESGNGIGYTYLNIRGFDQRRISVMVNGVPQNDPEDHNVYWLDFSDLLANISDIQVQRGAGNLMSGAPTIGGSVNLVTSNFARQPVISLMAGVGSFNTRKYSLSLSSGMIDEKYAITARLSKIKSDGYREQSWVDFNSYFLSAARFDETMTTQIVLYGGPVADHLAYYGIPKSDLSDRTKRRANPISRPEELENFSQPFYQVLNEWKVTDKITLSNTFFYFEGDGFFDYDGSWAPYSYYRITPANGFSVAGDPDTLYIPGALIHACNINHQYGWLPRVTLEQENGTLILGADVRVHRSEHWGTLIWGNDVPVGVTPHYRYYYYRGAKDMAALFGHELYQLAPQWTVLADVQVAATRYRLYDESYVQTDFTQPYFFVNPKIGVNYNMNQKFNAYISVSRTSREPRLKNLYDAAESSTPASWGTPVVPQYTVKANGEFDYSKPLVTEETMNAVELGGAYVLTGVHCGINFYYMLFDNEIVKSGRLDRFGQPVTGNAKQTLHRGVEFTGSVQAGEWFDISGNLTLSRNTFVKHTEYSSSGALVLNDKRIAGFPDLLTNVRLTCTLDNFSTSAAVRYVGTFYTTNREESNREVDAATVVDWSAEYRLREIAGLQSVYVRVQVNNLFDRLYATNGEKDDYFPAATRNFFLTVGIDL